MHGIVLAGQEGDAEMEDEVILVGQQDADHRGIILVRRSGVAVNVVQVLVLKLVHEFQELGIDVVVRPEDALSWRDLALAFRDAVARLELPPPVHVEPDVNALVLEALDPQSRTSSEFRSRCRVSV